MAFDLSITRFVRAFVVILVVLALVSVVGLYFESGLSALPEPLLFLYISVVLAYGVFRQELEHPRVQVAFGIGVAGYGALVYLQTGGIFWLVLGIAAVVIIGRNVLFLRE